LVIKIHRWFPTSHEPVRNRGGIEAPDFGQGPDDQLSGHAAPKRSGDQFVPDESLGIIEFAPGRQEGAPLLGLGLSTERKQALQDPARER
jgi:hypothetical protein